MMTDVFWSIVSSSIIGRETEICTVFGKRRITYADFTASGRGVSFIEDYLTKVLESYGNTHTDDDYTGSQTSLTLHEAEDYIKEAVNADERYRVIECGYGTTGAVHRLQEILGVYIPPVAYRRLQTAYGECFTEQELCRLGEHLKKCRPVVFVGPYEHHSNEVSWRECFAEVVEIELNQKGTLDLEDLKRKLSVADYRNRQKIGAFSAASNVTGLKTPIYQVARILHQHDALAFFDFAAVAPYARIDMCHDEESFFDGIYFSPHKFLGGPGSAGILIIHERAYRTDLPPTCGAGGTVSYVNYSEHEYYPDIEVREKPGTPGILQTIKAALAMELKNSLGINRIEQRDSSLIAKALARFKKNPSIEILGNQDPAERIAICSFNIKAGTAYLHPRFVVKLLNDLFGIQSRAGCSCAGPYGHRLLGIDKKTSDSYREEILRGNFGIKPGWCRIGFHFLLTDEEFDFICDAVDFIAGYGKYFLPLYEFDIRSGSWNHRSSVGYIDQALHRELADNAFMKNGGVHDSESYRRNQYKTYMQTAMRMVRVLKPRLDSSKVQTTKRQLIQFVYYE